jgi:hypothetical protein
MRYFISRLSYSVVFVVISLTAYAQPYQKGTLSLSAGAELLIPQKRLSAFHRNGPAATAKAEYVFGKHATATLVSGYYFLAAQSKQMSEVDDFSAIPLKAGVRYYLGSFYGSGEAGALFASGFNPGTGFIYSLGMGDKISINGRVIDIALRHESWVLNRNTNGLIAIRVGYEFAVNQRKGVEQVLY